MTRPAAPAWLDRPLVRAAMVDAIGKLAPRHLLRNPVIATVAVAGLLTTGLGLRDLLIGRDGAGFALHVALWLWLTVLFANLAEAIAEGRGKAQAASLRRGRADVAAKRLLGPGRTMFERVSGTALAVGDHVLVEAGDIIPGDGDAIDGIASVDESAITGESAPVIRESGGDRSAVTGGTRILSDWLVVRISRPAGSTFLDHMIALVEGAERQKTPTEISLTLLLSGLTLIFLLATVTIAIFARHAGGIIPIPVLAALLVTLIPTTIGGLLSAIGIAGMNRLVRFNVLARSGRAVEAAGDIDTLLLDKTGTVTLGNRVADALVPMPGIDPADLAQAALLASLADDTPEGRSVVSLAQQRHGCPLPAIGADWHFIRFSAHNRMSGVDLPTGRIRKGAVDAMRRYLIEQGGSLPPAGQEAADRIAQSGGTPLIVVRDATALGVIHLKDQIKPGMRDRFAALRRMGIRTVMVTGDNPLTAAAIAAEAGLDDVLAEATPEAKLALIRAEQAKGKLVAMCGDGTNDAPALAQADVGLAMNSGTQAAKEAGNMIDLDSDPTKLIEVVAIGKQLLMTRGALTTFSIANDVAKYFVILPAMFAGIHPLLGQINPLGLHSPASAILAAIIFNALIIPALVPLALRGVAWRPEPAARILSRNLLLYGLGGLIAPFAGIKAIDLLLAAAG